MRKATDKSTEPLQTITDRRACCHNSNSEVPQREQVVDALQHLHSPGPASQVNCVRGDRDAHTRSKGVKYSDGDSDSTNDKGRISTKEVVVKPAAKALAVAGNVVLLEGRLPTPTVWCRQPRWGRSDGRRGDEVQRNSIPQQSPVVGTD